MLPLLWGTLYISFIALLVAVPIGLLAAIYLSEYASPRLRSIAKPAVEVLAGIPTIVYGLFALVTVGPMLRDWIAQPLGLGNSGSSVMTAGLVMGIMLIPFVSLAVRRHHQRGAAEPARRRPRPGRDALRDGAQVVLPAALPGIVGAILLAASRAIGETMIVVLGAGAAATISANPFEAMTTITVKIVSQLTGDNDFSSPETLVAFALGLTLFVITLGLNVIALYHRAQVSRAVRMTDHPRATGAKSLYVQDARTRRRNAAEKRFRAYGLTAIVIACTMLAVLVFTIVRNGSGAFRQTYLSIPVALDAQVLDPKGNRDPAEMAGRADPVLWPGAGPGAGCGGRADLDLQIEGLESGDIDGLISRDASAQLRDRVLADPDLVGQTVDVERPGQRPHRRLFQGPRHDGDRGARQQHLARAADAGRRAGRRRGCWSRGSTGAS